MADKNIRISEELHDAISKVKGNASFDEFLKKQLKGTIIGIPTIRREEVAFTLENVYYDANGNFEELFKRRVTFYDLANAKVGDKFYPPSANLQEYLEEELRVIYKEETNVLVELITWDSDGSSSSKMYNVYIF